MQLSGNAHNSHDVCRIVQYSSIDGHDTIHSVLYLK